MTRHRLVVAVGPEGLQIRRVGPAALLQHRHDELAQCLQAGIGQRLIVAQGIDGRVGESGHAAGHAVRGHAAVPEAMVATISEPHRVTLPDVWRRVTRSRSIWLQTRILICPRTETPR